MWSRRRALVGLSCVCATACEGTDPRPRSASEPLPPRPDAVPRVEPPGEHPHAALGSLDELAPELRRVFTDMRGFASLPAPKRTGWRAVRPEPAQDVESFLASAPNLVEAPREHLVLLPLGNFPFDVIEGRDFVGLVRTPELDDLAELVTAFFGLPADVMAQIELDVDELPARDVPSGRQLDVHGVLALASTTLPAGAYGMLALVNHDLFAWPEQQFAFGYSTHTDRVGVMGFSRFDPSFYGGARPDDLAGVVLRRSARVLLHETAHLFGMRHCQYFRCLLNGVADLTELDDVPLHLCPVCLRKLHLATGNDPRDRYLALLPVLERLGLGEELTWTRARLQRILSG
jgi:archaemetzincin